MYWHCIDCDRLYGEDFKGSTFATTVSVKELTCSSDPHHILKQKDVEKFIKTPDDALKQYLLFEMEEEKKGKNDEFMDECLHDKTLSGWVDSSIKTPMR